MTEFFGGVLCWLGLHDWFYYERYNLEGERPDYLASCGRIKQKPHTLPSLRTGAVWRNNSRTHWRRTMSDNSKCTECGGIVTDDSNFCATCQAHVETVEQPATSSDIPLSGRIENALRYGMATESIARELLKDCQSRIRELEPTATSSDVTISRKDAAQIERFMRWYDANDGEAEWPEVEAYKNLKAAMEKSNGTM